jgi:cobalt/nickel transport system permease protein
MEIIEHTYLAIKSRVGTEVHYKKGQHIVAWNMASLWHRSYLLNEMVYSAMLSRGYSGEPIVVHDFKTRPRDWVWLIFAAALVAAVLYFGARAGS